MRVITHCNPYGGRIKRPNLPQTGISSVAQGGVVCAYTQMHVHTQTHTIVYAVSGCSESAQRRTNQAKSYSHSKKIG